MNTHLVHSPVMGTSPFHGIFSSLQKTAVPLSQKKPPVLEPDISVTTSQALERAKGQVAVDIFELDNYYIIKAPIAGVKLADLDIEISDNVITIRGSRQQTDDLQQDQYYLQECFWGEFSRSITLPCSIDPKKVKATFNKECILKILVPKEERVKIVRINEN